MGLGGWALAAGPLPEATLRDQAVQLQNAALTAPRPAWLETQKARQAQWRRELQVAPPIPQTPAPALQPPEVGGPDGLRRPPPPDPSPTPSPTDAPVPTPTLTVTLLVSRALGEASLRELFARAAGRPDVRLVFRGVAENESLTDFLRGIHRLLPRDAGDSDTALPTVELDPRPFQTPAVDLAPTMIATNAHGEELARVTGLDRPEWLLERVRRGERGDLGVRGPTVAIDEPDLIEELQRRVANVDWQAKRDAALARYWERTTFAALPTATVPRERRLDLTVTATAPVELPDGTRLVEAGAHVNPLDVMPFRQRLFVFDASDPRQVASVAHRGQASRAEGKLPLYLASQLDRDAGWAGFRAVQETLGEPLYQLTPEVQSRFRIERVPAVIEAGEGTLVVREWPPEG
jgi:conjugal transfer pilus assembly protein TraW